MTAAVQEQTDRAVKLGPFSGGLHNASGSGEFIENEELYELINMEVDTDGSLVNRPQINLFNVTGTGNTNGMTFLGTYLPSDGRKFIVAYLPVAGGVFLIDATTGAQYSATTSSNLKAVCCIQYANRLWVIATTDSPGNGGYFDVPTSSTVSWTLVPTMPRGEAVTQYRERLWIACGLSAITNTSRFYFSAVGDPSIAWDVNNYIDCAAGNGQKLVSLVRLGQDIVLFKEHSTHKFTYTTDPRKAELNEIDANIGVPAINCHVVYNNNTIYVMHDNAVYELFQYTYTRISTLVNMVQESDLDLFAKDQYGLTIHRDRLFTRYFKNLYVYSLRTKRWSSWVTTRKFSKLVVIPSATVGLDTAYAASASITNPSASYSFQDVRGTSDTGGTSAVAATRVGHNDYTSAGARVTTYDVAATGAIAGDWVYIIQQNYWEVANLVPVPPVGFAAVVPRQAYGVMGGGCEWFMWRKKWVAGETTYTTTLPTSRFIRASAIIIRGGSDDPVLLGPPSIARGAANPSVLTVPGIPEVPAQTLVLTVDANNPAAAFTAPPTSVNGATYWFTSPMVATTNLISVHYALYTIKQATSDVVITWPLADTGRVGGMQIGIPPKVLASDPSIERFQGQITTKTYDFDLPQHYKVIFWWGIALATSGKIVASLNIPNANKNMTYREALAKYTTWANAIAAKQAWSSNASIQVSDTVYPSLGRYARKFIKLLKKVRFRQVYFTVTFDVVSNGGIADASLRVYDLTVFMKKKQTVVRETS